MGKKMYRSAGMAHALEAARKRKQLPGAAAPVATAAGGHARAPVATGPPQPPQAPNLQRPRSHKAPPPPLVATDGTPSMQASPEPDEDEAVVRIDDAQAVKGSVASKQRAPPAYAPQRRGAGIDHARARATPPPPPPRTPAAAAPDEAAAAAGPDAAAARARAAAAMRALWGRAAPLAAAAAAAAKRARRGFGSGRVDSTLQGERLCDAYIDAAFATDSLDETAAEQGSDTAADGGDEAVAHAAAAAITGVIRMPVAMQRSSDGSDRGASEANGNQAARDHPASDERSKPDAFTSAAHASSAITDLRDAAQRHAARKGTHADPARSDADNGSVAMVLANGIIVDTSGHVIGHTDAAGGAAALDGSSLGPIRAPPPRAKAAQFAAALPPRARGSMAAFAKANATARSSSSGGADYSGLSASDVDALTGRQQGGHASGARAAYATNASGAVLGQVLTDGRVVAPAAASGLRQTVASSGAAAGAVDVGGAASVAAVDTAVVGYAQPDGTVLDVTGVAIGAAQPGLAVVSASTGALVAVVTTGGTVCGLDGEWLEGCELAESGDVRDVATGALVGCAVAAAPLANACVECALPFLSGMVISKSAGF